MNKGSIITALAFVFFLSTQAAVAQHVTYNVSFPNLEHHEADVELIIEGASVGQLLEFRMSRTSPGRYALHEFAKNVYSVSAHDAGGHELDINRPNPHQWNVVATDSKISFKYTIFADRAGGTYTGIDRTHAHLNMPATFAYVRQFSDAPITIAFSVEDSTWNVATQLVPTEHKYTFTAPNLYYFLDSPTEISDFSQRTWDATFGDRSTEIRLAVHHAETEQEVDAYAEMAKKVVAEEIAVYGALPKNDYGTYTFLADYLPHVSGDGMEHRNSTYIVSTRPLSTGALRNLGTLAHEYFHQWNVERIRPLALEPFNFEEANMTGELWFSEGFTSYYTGLVIRRTGLNSDAQYASALSNTVNTVVNSPGRHYFSAREMSMQAPFVDAAQSVDPTNRANTFISYYTFGSGIGLGLDLSLRRDFPGKTLDGFMQLMWQTYGETEIPFTNNDLKQTLGKLVDDQAYADNVFARYIEGKQAFDYAPLLAQAGFLLRKANAGQGWLGASFVDRDGGVSISSSVLKGSPLYEAGVSSGDAILRWDDAIVTDSDQLSELLENAQPGASVELTFRTRGQSVMVMTTVTEDPSLEVVLMEDAGQDVTDEMLRFRSEWLRSKVK